MDIKISAKNFKEQENYTKYLNPQPNMEMEFGNENCAMPMINISLDIKYSFGYWISL